MERTAAAYVVSRRSLVVHAACVAGAALAAGCRSAPASCNDVTGLSSEQRNVRDTLGYVDRSEQSGKTCAKCSQYVDAPSVDACGQCKVLPGPVHPNGYCRAFTPKG